LNKRRFKQGLRDGVPIGLGYLTVSFSVGIACRNAGLDAVQGFFISLLNVASAGEYAGLRVISADSGFITIALMMLVVNARYLLMSCALSQKFSPRTPFIHRFLVGYGVTDELFGIAISHRSYLSPEYYYGAMLSCIPLWCLGTVLGVEIGNLLPTPLVSAFSVSLFGMFIAIIIPAARRNRVVLGCVAVSFVLSYLFHTLSFFSFMSDGTQIIVLTVVISTAAALLFPIKEEDVNKK